MSNQWQAQHVMNEQMALRMVQEQFPNLHATTIKLLGVGWDNTAYIVNNEFVFRFPRRDVAVDLLKYEMVALPTIVKQVDLKVPDPLWQGQPTQDYPWPFLGYKMLSGMTADCMNLSDEQRIAIAQPLAQFLSKLHSIILKESIADQLPQNVIFQRLGLDYLIPTVKINLKKLESIGHLDHKEKLYQILDSAHTLRAPVNDTLVHGDLYCRHLLVDDMAKLTGVIDWGDVQIGDPAIDLSLAHTFLPSIAHENFKKSYGFISDGTWNLARFRAVHHSLLLILYGNDIGDTILVREGKRALGYIAEQIVINN